MDVNVKVQIFSGCFLRRELRYTTQQLTNSVLFDRRTVRMENELNAQQFCRPQRPIGVPAHRTSPMMTPPPSRSTRGSERPLPSHSEATDACQAAVAGPSNAKKPRKERGPNWIKEEVLALIRAKRDMFLEELQKKDARELMVTDTTKWVRIAQDVQNAGFSPCFRDGPACKTKWNQVLPDYKRLSDYFGRSGQNVEDYWDLTATTRATEGLPRQFPHEFYYAIHEWCGDRPQMQPAHLRDILNPVDSNFERAPSQSKDEPGLGNDNDTVDPLHVHAGAIPVSTDDNTSQHGQPGSSSGTVRRGPLPINMQHAQGMASTSVQPPMATHISVSSDTANSDSQRRPGSTGVRRKSISGHTLLADATKSTGAVMAAKMKEVADASLQVERHKIEVQQSLFSAQMEYQKDRDVRLHESAMTAHENARLVILKQTDMVQCLSQLTSILGAGFIGTSRGTAVATVPCFTPAPVMQQPAKVASKERACTADTHVDPATPADL